MYWQNSGSIQTKSMIFSIGVGGCIGGWAACETVHFSLPSDARCKLTSDVRDLGPPEDCDHAPGEHGRTFFVTSLATGTGSTSSIVAEGRARRRFSRALLSKR